MALPKVNTFIKTAKTPASQEEFLAWLDSLLRRNTGSFTNVGYDTSSNIPFRLPITTKAMAQGLNEYKPLPVVPQEVQTPSVLPTRAQIKQQSGQSDSREFINALKNTFEPQPVQTLEDGGTLYNNGTIRYEDGTERQYTGVTAIPVMTMTDGRIQYSDGSFRGPAPTPVKQISASLAVYSDGTVRAVNPITSLSGLQQSMFGGGSYDITQAYGNINTNMGYANNTHLGTDIGAVNQIAGLPFHGVVLQRTTRDTGSPYGNSVLIRLDSGEMLRFSHLSETPLTQGMEVNPGDYIGTTGSTGNSTGPHLDLEYYNQNGKIDDINDFSLFKNPESVGVIAGTPVEESTLTPEQQEAVTLIRQDIESSSGGHGDSGGDTQTPEEPVQPEPVYPEGTIPVTSITGDTEQKPVVGEQGGIVYPAGPETGMINTGDEYYNTTYLAPASATNPGEINTIPYIGTTLPDLRIKEETDLIGQYLAGNIDFNSLMRGSQANLSQSISNVGTSLKMPEVYASESFGGSTSKSKEMAKKVLGTVGSVAGMGAFGVPGMLVGGGIGTITPEIIAHTKIPQVVEDIKKGLSIGQGTKGAAPSTRMSGSMMTPIQNKAVGQGSPEQMGMTDVAKKAIQPASVTMGEDVTQKESNFDVRPADTFVKKATSKSSKSKSSKSNNKSSNKSSGSSKVTSTVSTKGFKSAMPSSTNKGGYSGGGGGGGGGSSWGSSTPKPSSKVSTFVKNTVNVLGQNAKKGLKNIQTFLSRKRL